MTLTSPARLAIAVVASALLHTAALLPVKAPSGPFVPTPLERSLNVRLYNPAVTPPVREADAEPAGTPPSVVLPATPVTAVPEIALLNRPARLPPNPPRTDMQPDIATPVARAPDPAQSAGKPDMPSIRPGMRAALPVEVNIYVRRYDTQLTDNPVAVLTLASGSYYYFNAPQLQKTASPLADISPRYPSTKLDYAHGAVILLLFIDEEGRLEKTVVECAQPAFEGSALASMQGMHFAAARDANGPVKSYMKVEFRYGLGTPCGRLPHNLPNMKLN